MILRNSGPTIVDFSLACFALIGAIVMLTRGNFQSSVWSPVIASATLMYVAVIAIYDLSRHLWSSYWLRVVRPLDHDLKITAVLFAMMSAAAGNLFPQLLPWAAIIPNLTGIVLMVALVILHLRNHEKNGVQYRS